MTSYFVKITLFPVVENVLTQFYMQLAATYSILHAVNCENRV